jgi:spore maturation protein CgeB
LSVSSSWGNGHATLLRGLLGSLARKGCRVTFFERDVPYYADARDVTELPHGELVLYADWDSIAAKARREVRDADAVVITSFCPDGIIATQLALATRGVKVFYDLDSPVTLAALSEGRELSYIGPGGLSEFDLVLSYTGGDALEGLKTRLGARRVAPLYGHANPEQHRPAARVDRYACDLSYLGTYAADRQKALESLFVEPASVRPQNRFLIGGAQYPQSFPWLPNVFFVRHLPPAEHPAFYSSSRLTLNVTRGAMMRMGWCPSGRLFEAASCGTAILSDAWEGVEAFYEPGAEILLARSPDDVLAALELSDREIAAIAGAARERTLSAHTSDHRAAEFLDALSAVRAERTPLMEAL